jgi:hypothetical protein
MMIGKLPKKIVSANLAALQTGSKPLIEAAKERVSS